MANENITLKTGIFKFEDTDKITQSDLDPIASMYPQTMITDQAVKAALNKLYGFSDSDAKEEKQETPEEEYIWVEGYKGTDKDMKCRDYQYKLNEKFDMPEDAKINICYSGFHLCPELKDVFKYYDLKDGNRFFKVMAHIPKSQTVYEYDNWTGRYITPNKYAAKSIVFMSECTPREILTAKYGEEKIKDFTDEEIVEAYKTSYHEVHKRKVIAELVALGYSEDIAKIAFENDREYLARALAKQTNISWDTRILALINSTLDMD